MHQTIDAGNGRQVPTPRKGRAIILRHLRSRYPRAVWKTIGRGSWHVYMQHVRVITDTTFSVQTECPVLHADGSLTEPPRVVVDILAGTCTCGAGGPCAHLFAAVMWAQMEALDRAYRATHENVCRKRWCAGRRNPWALLCESHQRELRRDLEWQELQELRKMRTALEAGARDDAA
jgi:hypothetical protein